ncbi:hypothetical protein ELY11_07185 [Legionella septentrionalis]|nr:hypothetical protein ELY11_07185 [Legionella septentrionalis]
MWISQNEGAKFWLNVLTDIKNRGLDEIFIACIDGLTGFPKPLKLIMQKFIGFLAFIWIFTSPICHIQTATFCMALNSVISLLEAALIH